MKPVTTNSAELQALRDGLLACSPRREESPPDPERQIQEIEHRSRLATVRRRWFVGGAAVSMVALVLVLMGAVWRQRPARPALQPQLLADSGQHFSTAETATVVDLGPDVGRILLRPRTRASYTAKTHTLSLRSGRIVAHIFPRGRGFRVRFGGWTVSVKGTLFSVDADSGDVHVWHGVVEHKSGAGWGKTLQGTEAYGTLSKRDLAWLAFTPPKGSSAEPARVPNPQAPLHTMNNPDRATGDDRLADDRPPYHPDPMRQDLLQAQQELAAGQAEEALAHLELYEARFPASPLLEEACLLKLRALVQLKRFRRLQQMSHMFLKRYPGSAKRGEVELLQKRAAAHLEQAGSR